MRTDWKRRLLLALALVLALGTGVRLREIPVRAQAGEGTSQASGKPAAANDVEVDENDPYLHSANVQKFGAMLGMDAEHSATAFGIVNFVLLAAGIGWIVMKVVPSWLRGRNEAIQKNLADARTATEEARGRLSVVEGRLAKLDGEIAALRGQAEEDSARDELRIRESVEEEKKKILAAAEQEIAAATAHAQKQLQRHAAELAIEQAARKLVVSAETDRLLVQGFAERLTGSDTKKGTN